jgi:hypothetical protein
MTKSKNKKMYGGQEVSRNVQSEFSAVNKTFVLSQPMNFIFFITFFSPVILIILITFSVFFFRNFKGPIYFGFILASSIIRNYVLKYSGSPALKSDGTICTSIQFSKYGNATFGTFVFAFTLMYLCMPMFQNGSVNWLLFSGLLFYIFLDIGIKAYEGCFSLSKDGASIFLDLLAGMSFGVLISTIMNLTGNSKYMFFNETSSDKEVCSVSKNQTFRCDVYKNNELVV